MIESKVKPYYTPLCRFKNFLILKPFFIPIEALNIINFIQPFHI